MFRSRLLSRLLHCKGCGNTVNHTQRLSEQKKPTFSVREHQQAHYDQIYEKLSPIQKEALSFIPEEIHVDEDSSARIKSETKLKKKQERFEKFCRSCIDIQDGRSLPLNPTSMDVMEQIPQDANVVHVIDAMDFPASVVPGLLERPHTEYVIARADLVLNHKNQVPRFKEFAMSEVFTPAGIPAANVHVVSAKKRWGLNGPLLQRINGESFFVGKTNSGKSQLINALTGSKTESWPVPFMTQQPMVHDFKGNQFVDMPSFPETSHDGKGIYSLLRTNHIRKIGNGKMILKKNNLYNVVPTLVKPGQTVSLGGLAAITIPKSLQGNATHVWSVHGVCGPKVTRVFSSLNKIGEIAKSTERAHEGWTITESSENFEHRFDVDATKALTLVIRGLGPVFLQSFGRYTKPNVASVYSLPGVEVYQRGEVLPFITKRQSKRGENQKEKRDETQE